MSSAIVLNRYKGHECPEDFVSACLESSTAISIAMAVMSLGKKPMVSVTRKWLSEMPDQLKGVMTAQEKFKDKDMLLFFDSPPEGTTKEQMQPFPLLVNEDNKPILVAFIEGVDNPEDEVKEYFGPKCVELFEQCGYDLPKLVEKMQTPLTSSEIGGRVGDGSITFMFGHDMVMQLGKEGCGKDEDWGWTTLKAEGESPVTETETGPQPEPSVEDELDAALGGDATPAAPEPQAAPTPPKTQLSPVARPLNRPVARPVATAAAGKPAIAKPVVQTEKLPAGGTPDPDFEKVFPPVGLRFKDLVRWGLKRMEKMPPDAEALYKKGEFFALVPKPKVIGKDMKALATANVKTVEAKPAHVPPILPPDERKAVVDNFLKDKVVAFLDENGADILDPKLLKDFEEKHSDIAQQIGLPNLGATFHWTLEDRIQLGEKQYGIALPLLATWLTYELIKRDIELYNLRPKTALKPAVQQPAAAAAPAAQPRRAVARAR